MIAVTVMPLVLAIDGVIDRFEGFVLVAILAPFLSFLI